MSEVKPMKPVRFTIDQYEGPACNWSTTPLSWQCKAFDAEGRRVVYMLGDSPIAALADAQEAVRHYNDRLSTKTEAAPT